MDDRQFDLIARAQGAAGSRRQGLKLLIGGVLGPVLARFGSEDAAAASCGGCPPGKPCCIKGTCRKRCGDKCCANCFVERDSHTGQVIQGTEVCCNSTNGTICGGKKPGPGDDRCCYPDEKCVNGKCCGHNALGSKKCGDKCCPIASCCNGKCCKNGRVCAGEPKKCVSANRNCGNCLTGEDCVADTCCTEHRVCAGTEAGTVCCPYGQYCDTTGPLPPRCCPVNHICNTYRGHRVRP